MSVTNSAVASMTKFREVESTADDLEVELEVKNQLDKYRTHTNPEVGGGQKQKDLSEIQWVFQRQ